MIYTKVISSLKRALRQNNRVNCNGAQSRRRINTIVLEGRIICRSRAQHCWNNKIRDITVYLVAEQKRKWESALNDDFVQQWRNNNILP